MSESEPTNIGLSVAGHDRLKWLQEEGYFGRMLDAYRCGVAVALGQGVIPEEFSAGRTVFGVSTVDPDREMFTAVKALLGDNLSDVPVYRMIERLADWGVLELASMAESEGIEWRKLKVSGR